MKTFDDYYKKSLKGAKTGAKNNKMSVEDFIKTFHRMTMEEYKESQKKRYEAKGCHSFWHRECVNRGIECYRCSKFYSYADWDKMTIKERNNIENS
jgi:hypothetical protein